MSLILEALRKSEAERRRAQMPDLLTEPQVAAPVALRTPQRWPWLAAGAVVVLGAVWFASRDVAPVEAKATPVNVAAETRAASPIKPAPSPARSEPATTRPAPPVQRPLVIAPPAAPPTAVAAAPESVVPAKPGTQALPAPPLDSRIRANDVAGANDVARRNDVVPAPAPAPVANTTERVTDLGNDERKQLPPLKLSMHMWNDASSERFVIIDGTRLGVGDHLGAVVVADILPDGVLLDWNGRPLKLPLR